MSSLVPSLPSIMLIDVYRNYIEFFGSHSHLYYIVFCFRCGVLHCKFRGWMNGVYFVKEFMQFFCGPCEYFSMSSEDILSSRTEDLPDFPYSFPSSFIFSSILLTSYMLAYDGEGWMPIAIPINCLHRSPLNSNKLHVCIYSISFAINSDVISLYGLSSSAS